jgi:predicted dienelactone hydrolase
MLALLVAAGAVAAQDVAQDRSNPVGMRQIEFADGDRRLALAMFYPALNDTVGRLFDMPFFSNLHLLQDARPDFGAAKRPLVMLSHGRGSNGLLYAWFAEYLAARYTSFTPRAMTSPCFGR